MPDRRLTMKFAGRFIFELLGQQMYGGPVPAVAELVANAWDADSTYVEIRIPEDPTVDGSEIAAIQSFEELDRHYLSIGYERRTRGRKEAWRT
jgi:hypothetical protein